jgi:hypothetical protein
MKILFLILVFICTNASATDSITFQIDHLLFEGNHGIVKSKEIDIVSGSSRIGFKAINDPFSANILIQEKNIIFTGTNGMYMETETPVNLNDTPLTIVENGMFTSNDTQLALSANYLSTSVAGIKLDAANINFNCELLGKCHANAGQLVFDEHTLLINPTFKCIKSNCEKSFELAIAGFEQGNNITVNRTVNKSLVELHNLRTISLKRNENNLDFEGKIHLWVGVVGFVLKTEIVAQNNDILELHIGSLRVEDFISLKDFSLFLARKLITTKKITMEGDNLTIHLH